MKFIGNILMEVLKGMVKIDGVRRNKYNNHWNVEENIEGGRENDLRFFGG